MKRFFAALLAMAMVFSLGVTAFAAENTGSITISNATIGQSYAVYKIFDASISIDASDETKAVAYSITTGNQFFAALFGVDGTTPNPYFVYNANTGSVTKQEGVNDSDLINYLTALVNTKVDNELVYEATRKYDDDEVTTDVVTFSDLPYGYYVITSTLGAAVTINSNTPDVTVIDKNQEPGGELSKKVQVGEDEDGNPIWDDANSANIGDKITYQISFVASNYDGDKLIKYYQIHDEKGDAIWADFESFRVYVNGERLDRGYYLAQGGDNTDNWEYLGDWSDIPEDERDRNDAEWYLVHLDYDKFRITIPWLTGHDLQDVTDGEGKVISYSLNFGEGATSKFDSPATVEIIYDAMVEANAAIGGTTHGNRYNKAYASWISEHETGSTPPDEVVTRVYGIGLLKDDIATGVNLAGAKFRIYSDADCTEPVYVIPTDVEGVYIVDSLNTPLEKVSGTEKSTSRKVYKDYLAAYLGEDYETTKAQDNLVVSQVNGKLVVLGLEAGTYYLMEVEAPAGYNALTAPVEIIAGENTRPFMIYADKDGKVADIQVEDGVHSEIRYDLSYIVVHNSKGVVLPSTGGQGTIMLITFGTLIAIAFAVLMITQKKMTAYRD